jgi:putative hemolysin
MAIEFNYAAIELAKASKKVNGDRTLGVAVHIGILDTDASSTNFAKYGQDYRLQRGAPDRNRTCT